MLTQKDMLEIVDKFNSVTKEEMKKILEQYVDKEPEPEMRVFKGQLLKRESFDRLYQVKKMSVNGYVGNVFISEDGTKWNLRYFTSITFPDVAFSIGPEWANWIAQNYDGVWNYFEDDPKFYDLGTSWLHISGRHKPAFYAGNYNPDWRNTKQKRPEYL